MKTINKRVNFIIKGTHLQERLARGDPGINPLDAACKDHDIAYESNDSNVRYLADDKLQKAAMKRAFGKNVSLGERTAAIGVAAAMKAKKRLTKVGKGMKKGRCSKQKKKQITFSTLVKHAKVAIKKSKPETVDSAIQVAVNSVKKNKRGKQIKTPRVIKLPTYSGGVIPLIPIFAGLSALGSIVGSAAGVASAINRVKSAEKELSENKRHNETMEAIAIGKRNGNGFYLHSTKNGEGFYLAPNPKNL